MIKKTEPLYCRISSQRVLWLATIVTMAVIPQSACQEQVRTDSAPQAGGGQITTLEPAAMDILRTALVDADPRVRSKAVEVVAETGRMDLMPAVQRLLADGFVPVRFAAAMAVGDTAYEPAASMINRLLQGDDRNVRMAAAYAASRLGSKDALPTIRRAALSEDQTVRANAAMLLGKVRDRSDIKLLKMVLRDENSSEDVRFQAVEALAVLGDERIDRKIWTMLISAYADDRIMGIKAMSHLNTPEAKNAISTMLDDDVLEVRLEAAGQLGAYGDTSGEKVILEALSGDNAGGIDTGSLERVMVMAALGAGRICTDPLAVHLEKLLENQSIFIRLAAAKSICQCVSSRKHLFTRFDKNVLTTH